jgi:hypothetical protein
VFYGLAAGLIGDPRVEHNYALAALGRSGHRVGGRVVHVAAIPCLYLSRVRPSVVVFIGTGRAPLCLAREEELMDKLVVGVLRQRPPDATMYTPDVNWPPDQASRLGAVVMEEARYSFR